MGLLSSHGLVGEQLSGQIRRRAAAAYAASAEARAQLAPGQAMARSGQLAWRRHSTRLSGAEPAQRVRERAEQLAAGRASQDAARRRQLAERLVVLGAADLPSYLRSAYAAGASLEQLARATGRGRARLRQALADAGVQMRRTGANTPAGKKSRARVADARAAERLRVTDLHGWLRDRRADDWTLQQLADAVGHTSHWVAWRLEAAQTYADAGQTACGTNG